MKKKGERDEGNNDLSVWIYIRTLFMVFLFLPELIRRGEEKCILALLNLMAMLVIVINDVLLVVFLTLLDYFSSRNLEI